MGELHLEVYIERMKREYDCEVISGKPNVSYKETINQRVEFNWLHKKQTGGSGQYAKVVGFIEPLPEAEQAELGQPNEFINECTGTNIPPEYYTSCQKGTNDAFNEGSLVGSEVEGVRVVLKDGASHAVDSSDLAFRLCMANAIRDAMKRGSPTVLEPVMNVEVEAPAEFQGGILAGLNRRMGVIQSNEMNEDGSGIKALVDVPLANMFGYSTELRSSTQGKGEFTMEYLKHTPVPRNEQDRLMKKYMLKKAETA